MPEFLPSWETHDVESLRAFAHVRLVALDVDGTLLQQQENRCYYEAYRRQQRQLRRGEDKVEVTLATGRTLAGVQPLLHAWPLPTSVPMVLYNGSIVLLNGRGTLLSKKTISPTSLQRILETGRSVDAQVFAYFYAGADEVGFSALREPEYVLGWSTGERPAREFNQMEVRWQKNWRYDHSECPTAVLIATPAGSKVVACLESQLAGLTDVTLTRSGGAYLEIRPVGSNKGAALEVVARNLNVPRDAVLALGDNDNDAEMLAWAGIGVAVAGASPAALGNSDFICRHGVAEGAVELLRLLKSARRFFPSESSMTGGT